MDATPPLRKDGFRERGHQVTRLEAFVDASFAFAVTLLVIRVGTVPDTVAEMIEALKGIPAFAASFALIAMFWSAHNTWSRRYGLDDGYSMFLSLLLVFLVLLYVYPLRMLFGMAFAWASLALPEAFRIQSEAGQPGLVDLRWMYVIYAIAWSTLGFVILLLYRHAWNRRAALGLSVEEQVSTRMELARWWLVPALGFASLALAFALPFGEPLRSNPWWAGFPPMVYGLMGLTGVVMTTTQRRVRAKLMAEGATGTTPSHGTVPGKRRRRRRKPTPA